MEFAKSLPIVCGIDQLPRAVSSKPSTGLSVIPAVPENGGTSGILFPPCPPLAKRASTAPAPAKTPKYSESYLTEKSAPSLRVDEKFSLSPLA